MEIRYTETALSHRDFWKKSGRVTVMKKTASLTKSMKTTC